MPERDEALDPLLVAIRRWYSAMDVLEVGHGAYQAIREAWQAEEDSPPFGLPRVPAAITGKPVQIVDGLGLTGWRLLGPGDVVLAYGGGADPETPRPASWRPPRRSCGGCGWPLFDGTYHKCPADIPRDQWPVCGSCGRSWRPWTYHQCLSAL